MILFWLGLRGLCFKFGCFLFVFVFYATAFHMYVKTNQTWMLRNCDIGRLGRTWTFSLFFVLFFIWVSLKLLNLLDSWLYSTPPPHPIWLIAIHKKSVLWEMMLVTVSVLYKLKYASCMFVFVITCMFPYAVWLRFQLTKTVRAWLFYAVGWCVSFHSWMVFRNVCLLCTFLQYRW